MKELLIESSAQTPAIKFNPNNGLMEIIGRSIPYDSDAFWMPILSWFESYIYTPNEITTFKINLDYFNISSSKRILFLLYKLNELSDKGLGVSVIWEYRKDDEDMYEVGQDYAYMVKVPFEFIEIKEPDLVLTSQ
ncbi:DUF1987 domain-containing protein [Crocinitomicaceae bacterium]|nr:DUF1987 domain-containing protein [Crocinitomicaceae bacterium]